MIDIPHLIRDEYYLNEQAQQKLNENNHTQMKTHLEEKLKYATDVLVMMQDLVHELDLVHDINLIMMLQNKIALQALFIGSIKEQIETELKLVRVDNIFHEPIQFDVKELEARI